MAEPKVKPNKVPLFSMDRMGTTIDGKFMNAKQEAAYKANKTKGSRGPRSRGGNRTPTDVSERAIFKAEIGRQVATAKPAPAVAKKPAKASAPAVKAKATPTMTRGSMKRSAIPKAEMTVRDVVTENKISAPASSGIAKTKRDIKVGGLVGRTGGKWHLGKKVGKG